MGQKMKLQTLNFEFFQILMDFTDDISQGTVACIMCLHAKLYTVRCWYSSSVHLPICHTPVLCQNS